MKTTFEDICNDLSVELYARGDCAFSPDKKTFDIFHGPLHIVRVHRTGNVWVAAQTLSPLALAALSKAAKKIAALRKEEA